MGRRDTAGSRLKQSQSSVPELSLPAATGMLEAVEKLITTDDGGLLSDVLKHWWS